MEDRSSSQWAAKRARHPTVIPRKPVPGHDLPIAVEYMPYRSPIESHEEEPILDGTPGVRQAPFQYLPYRSPTSPIARPSLLQPKVHRRPSVTRRSTTRGRLNGGSFSSSVNRVSMRASVSNYSDYGVSPVSPLSGASSQSRRPSAASVIASVTDQITQYQSSDHESWRAPLSPLMELSAQEAAHRTSIQLQSSVGTVTGSRRGTLSSGSIYNTSIRRAGRSSSIGREDVCNWLPATLRWPFLIVLFLTTLGLGALILGLTIQSQRQQGLGTDGGSSALFFAWRFIPTILAVVYGMMTSALVLDIKRTETYARLSRPDGASAGSSLFLRYRSFWFEPLDALAKGRNDGFRSWGLFWGLLINLFALLIVSPFSSALISSRDVFHIDSAGFSRFSTTTPLAFSADDSTLSRTTSSILMNTATRGWITEDYAILPFYPSGSSDPFGSTISQSVQEWTAETTVYHAGYVCSTMNLQNFANFSLTRALASPPDMSVYATVNLTSLILKSDDGCSLGFAEFPQEYSPNSILEFGGGWWSGGSNFSYPPGWTADNGTADGLNSSYPFLLNTTSQCGGRDIFFLASSANQDTFRATGQVCKSSYYSATIPVTVSKTGSSSSVTFDEILFNITKTALSEAVFDSAAFENIFLGQAWASKFQSPNSGSTPNFDGPLALLAAENNFDLGLMMTSPLLATQARQAKQRFFGESMMSASGQNATQRADFVPGDIAKIERRIVVSFVTGILLTVVFILSSLMVGLIIGYTRLNERPLGLWQDPSSTSAMAALISSGQNTRALFEGMDTTSQEWMKKTLARNVFYLRHGVLYSYDVRDTYQHSEASSPAAYIEATRKPWIPRVLQSYALSFLVVSFFAIIVTLALLFVQFQQSGIAHTLPTWLSDLKSDRTSLIAVAPYSIITTLVAVIVRIWWSSVDQTFRRLQPYISMVQAPTSSSRGIKLSYISYPSFMVAGRAALNRHSLVAIVAVGAVLSEILIVSLSGLWTVNPGVVSKNSTLSQTMAFRTAPLTFTLPATSEQVSDNVLSSVYGNHLVNWLYGATLEGSYNATPLSWTSQGWSFAPVNLSSFEKQQSYSLLGSTQRATLTTSASRARLECTAIDTSNITSWLSVIQFQDLSAWNDSSIPAGLQLGYELKDGLSLPSTSSLYTPFLSTNSTVQCCGNQSSDGTLSQAAIGYWSAPADNPSQGIIVKWVTGHAFAHPFLDATNVSHWVWANVPQLTALNCTPVFETSSANVDFDVTTGVVEDFTIVGEVLADGNAWASNYSRVNASSNDSSQDISVSYGYLFHDILLGAADSARINQVHQSNQTEDLSDGTYNIRLPGLNADLMSYTALAMAQNNSSALLNFTTLANISSAVFSTFFNHFAQAAVTATDPVIIRDLVADRLTVEGTWGLQPRINALNVAAKLTTTTTQVNVNPASIFLSLSIFAFLFITSIFVISLNRQILKLLPRDVDNLGSVLGFVHGSDHLLRLATETPNKNFREEGDVGGLREMGGSSGREMAKMGWFNSGGRRRWGIEVMDSRHGDSVALMTGVLPFDAGREGPLMEEIHVSLGRSSGSGEGAGATERTGVAWGEGRRRVRGESFDTYEVIAETALRTPPRPAMRWGGYH